LHAVVREVDQNTVAFLAVEHAQGIRQEPPLPVNRS
jgi:hypothetical protein